jgi:outer membrane protein
MLRRLLHPAMLLAISSLACANLLGQFPTTTSAPLTLEQAEATALTNQPRMLAAQLRARSSAERIREARAAYQPTATFNATGVRVADTGASIAAGNITTSAVSGRFAYGANLTQMVTDFGRTSALVSSARATAQAQANAAILTRSQVRLNVREAYFQVLGAEAVLRAARAALDNRALISRQLSALAASELKSTLDVNFAKVLESEAELAVVRAESTVAQQRSHLATSMGQRTPVASPLVDVPLTPDTLPVVPDGLLAQSGIQRADLNVSVSRQKAAAEYALSEKKLNYPTLNALGAAGQIPFRDHTLHDTYAAAGFNLNIPIFNGGAYRARQAEANLEASARDRDTDELRLEVGEQVRDSWYRAKEAYKSLDVTSRLVAQSREALRLAQDRYDAGLGSIVELNEAQLNETSAQITSADAVYSYLSRRAELDYAAGNLN